MMGPATLVPFGGFADRSGRRAPALSPVWVSARNFNFSRYHQHTKVQNKRNRV